MVGRRRKQWFGMALLAIGSVMVALVTLSLLDPNTSNFNRVSGNIVVVVVAYSIMLVVGIVAIRFPDKFEFVK